MSYNGWFATILTKDEPCDSCSEIVKKGSSAISDELGELICQECQDRANWREME